MFSPQLPGGHGTEVRHIHATMVKLQSRNADVGFSILHHVDQPLRLSTLHYVPESVCVEYSLAERENKGFWRTQLPNAFSCHFVILFVALGTSVKVGQKMDLKYTCFFILYFNVNINI
jgi:hypothetical protein